MEGEVAVKRRKLFLQFELTNSSDITENLVQLSSECKEELMKLEPKVEKVLSKCKFFRPISQNNI